MNKLILNYLVTVFLVIFYISCKKTDALITPPVAENFDKPNMGCLVTKTGDLLGFGAYDLDFTYDVKGNPETFAGFLEITYDSKGRLYRQQSSLQLDDKNYIEWDYPDDNSFLPTSSSNYSNGVRVSTGIFTYDSLGRMIKNDRIYVNGFAAGEYIYNYTYDKKNNVQTIMQEGIDKPLFRAKAYDEKPNFTNANQWVKYILNDPGSGYIGLNYWLFSANNATEWSVADNGFDAATVNSYHTYNSQGFSIRDSTVFRDFINGDYSEIQTNSFKCQ